MTRRIGLLHGGASYHLRTLDDPEVARVVTDPVYLPDLGSGGLADLDAVVVADRVHPDLVARHADALLALPRRGADLVVLGEVDAQTWIPGLDWTPRPTNFWWWRTGEDPGVRRRSPEHPIWDHLAEADVVWHHHGLLHPAPGVTDLAVVEEDGTTAGSILSLDETSAPGRTLVTTMDPVHHHGSNFMPAATRFLHGMLRWLAE